MRGLKTASWAAVVALVCSMMVLGVSTSASAGSRAPGTAVRATAAGPADEVDTNNLLNSKFAAWLLDKAGSAAASQGFGMLFSLSGLNDVIAPDPNSRLLRQILHQLTEIRHELSVLNTNLNALIVQLSQDNLDTLLRELRSQVTNPLAHLFQGAFRRVIDAAEEYAVALENSPPGIPGTDEEVVKKYDALISRRNEFYVAFDACCGTSTVSIHDFLTPGPGSVLAALGRLFNGQHRYLTALQSSDVRNLYDQFADWEALAAWMSMERYLPAIDARRVPSGTFPGSLAAYNQARLAFLGYRRAEARNLVPTIPANVVIDGATANDSTNLAGARMYLPAATGLTYRPDTDVAGSVPRAVTELNARHAEGLDDWRVPTQVELTQLLAGKPAQPVTTGADFLRSLNPTSLAWGQVVGGTWQHLWSNADFRRTSNCWIFNGSLPVRDRNYPVHTHTAVSIATASPAWSPRPVVSPTGPSAEPRRPTDPSVCEVWLSGLFASNTGGLLAARTIGSMRIDYLARGTGPTLFPSANLRNADLSGLDLTGTDLTDADLTGASLTGAFFRDDEGTSGVNLTRARLTGVTSGGIVGDAVLPTGWQLTNGYLVGQGANLTDADLAGADLTGADLRGVTSGGVDCTGCKLPVGWQWTGLKAGGFLVGPGADLRGADLIGIDLRGADLTGAQLRGATLSGANLSGAMLRDLDLTGIDLRGSDLTGAELSRSTISGADFTGATLTGLRSFSLVSTPVAAVLPAPWLVRGGSLVGPGANLRGLGFAGVDLRGVRAPGADLGGANLSSANLTGVDLTGANLTGANLTGTDLTNAILVDTRFTSATVTDATFTTSNDNLLAGMVSGGVVGTPRALPATGRFRLVQGYLVGPNANLAGATFTSGAQLGGSLSGTNFTGADLSGLNLTGATLRNAILTNARLTGANLSGADMSNAMLDGVRSGGLVGVPLLPRAWRVIGRFLVGPGADLRGADLNSANLTLVDLGAADLTGANLSGANLSATNLEGAELAGAVITGVVWQLTMCPDGIRTRDTACTPAVWRGSSTATVSSDKSANQLLVDVGPSLSAGVLWRLTVQRLSESGGWVTASSHTTRGPGDTLRINLPAGSYRAVVPPQQRYRGSTSAPIVLAR